MLTSRFSYQFLSVLLLSAIVFSTYHDKDSDENEGGCQSEGKPGKCVEILECPDALRLVHIQRSHNFKRCGFHGNIEVICCPNELIRASIKKPGSKIKNSTKPTTGTQSRLNNRKCVQVCEEYSNEMKPDLTFHIIDGENAEPKEFPHMVALGYNSDTIGQLKWDCGGSLISERFVLTAAHCIINADQNPPVRVKMGTIKLNESSISDNNILEFDIRNITIHPNYMRWDKLNDIALIMLAREVKFNNYVRPACLYSKDEEPLDMIVTGWGTTESAGENSNILQKAKLTAVPLQKCNITYLERTNKNILRTQICAADNKSDTCQGDSGGPLQVQNIANSSVYSIVGVTSYGIGCASKYPGIYTRVYSYLDWIEEVVWNKNKRIVI